MIGKRMFRTIHSFIQKWRLGEVEGKENASRGIGNTSWRQQWREDILKWSGYCWEDTGIEEGKGMRGINGLKKRRDIGDRIQGLERGRGHSLVDSGIDERRWHWEKDFRHWRGDGALGEGIGSQIGDGSIRQTCYLLLACLRKHYVGTNLI